jgi:hypothetical protein
MAGRWTARHVAALGLLGWYLLMPPKNDPEAPLGQWEVIGVTYDSRSQCESLRTDAIQGWLILQDDLHPSAAELNGYVRASRCVSADDPRLKGN